MALDISADGAHAQTLAGLLNAVAAAAAAAAAAAHASSGNYTLNDLSLSPSLMATPTPTPTPTSTLTPTPTPLSALSSSLSPSSAFSVSSSPSTVDLLDVVYTMLANVTTTATTTTTTARQLYGYGEAATEPALIEDDELRLEHAPELSRSALIKVYVLSAMALLSLIGNVLTMWNIYKTRIARRNSRHSWSAIYSLIFHLSIADVLVTGFCIIGEAAWCYTVQWLANELTCKLVKLCQMFSLYLSTYVLVLIGVDRWIAVKYPMKSLNMAKRCYRLLGGTYVLSFLLSLPQFFIFHVARGPFIEEFHQCVTHGFYTAEWQEQLYTTFTLIFTFLLPLCILFGTYLSTFRTISNSEKMFQGSKLASYSTKPSAKTNRQRLIHKAKMKSLRISVVIIIAFLVCWTPYNVMMIIFMFLNPDKRLSEDLHSAIFFFGMSNSLVNPLIYGAFHLCPMKRKASKSGHNNATHSLNRGDSQRTPSMLTAVTQIDTNGRQIRTFHRQPSYYRTQSNGSGSASGSVKEHVSLLQVTPTSTLIRKTPSLRSSHGQHHAHHNAHQNHHAHHHLHHHHQLQHHHGHIHAASYKCNDNNSISSGLGLGNSNSNSNSSPHSTVVFSYDNSRAVGAVTTTRGTTATATATAGGINVAGLLGKNGTTVGSGITATLLERRGLIEESVSSV